MSKSPKIEIININELKITPYRSLILEDGLEVDILDNEKSQTYGLEKINQEIILQEQIIAKLNDVSYLNTQIENAQNKINFLNEMKILLENAND